MLHNSWRVDDTTFVDCHSSSCVRLCLSYCLTVSDLVQFCFFIESNVVSVKDWQIVWYETIRYHLTDAKCPVERNLRKFQAQEVKFCVSRNSGWRAVVENNQDSLELLETAQVHLWSKFFLPEVGHCRHQWHLTDCFRRCMNEQFVIQ